MKIAICQINTITADLEGNVQRCLDAVNQTIRDKPDLIVLPEMAVCGPFAMDILLDSSFVSALQTANLDFAWLNRFNPPILFGSLIASEKSISNHGNLLNSALLASNGTNEIVAQQKVLWDFDIHHDSRWFCSGEISKIIRINNTNIRPLIGKDVMNYSDLVFPENEKEPDLIIALHNAVFANQDIQEKIEHLMKIPYPSIVVNQVGGHDGLIFEGQSLFINPQKQKCSALKKFQTDTNFLSFPNTDFLPIQKNTQEADWLEAICLGIRDFVHKNNLKHVYLGLSGGIDSAVTTVLACQALGPENMTVLSLPSRFNDPRSTISSQELCNTLNINFLEISIEPFFNLFEHELNTLAKNENVLENIQARLRAVILMAHVNFYGGLLLNTSNKTELSLGYGTLYGDMAGTLSPIGDLTKPEVYQLARWINRSQEIIPEFILNRKPSAELRLNQVDPFDYPIISPQIENYVQNNQSPPSMRASEHKRHQFGTILKLSQKTFGNGRFIPITRR